MTFKVVGEPPRVVLISLDPFRTDFVSEELTPNLYSLGQDGGWARNGGRCQLPSVTYPSHASMLTGRDPLRHQVRTGLAGRGRTGTVPGWAGEQRVTGVPTVFDLCRYAGLKSAAICGDQYLWTILNACAADVSWPPDGALPEGAERDFFG